jgi:hypothetical protein
MVNFIWFVLDCKLMSDNFLLKIKILAKPEFTTKFAILPNAYFKQFLFIIIGPITFKIFVKIML